ncbi:MAG: MerR family transcriptional regulator [Clostridium sp.]
MEYMQINEVSELTGLKAHTLRYYESIGIIRDIKRDEAGKRLYSQQDLKWLEVVNRLRKTGMNINKMKEYARLRHIGDKTIKERKNIMEEHLVSIENEIEVLLKARDYVANKVKIYNEMEENINGK